MRKLSLLLGSILVPLVAFHALYISPVEASVSTQCASVGGVFQFKKLADNTNPNPIYNHPYREPGAKFGYYPDGEDKGKPMYYSIGAELFAHKHAFSMDATASWCVTCCFTPSPNKSRLDNEPGCKFAPRPEYNVTANADPISDTRPGKGCKKLHLLICPDMGGNPIEITTRAVHEINPTTGKVTRMLHGWLHIEVELKRDDGDEIAWVYMQMRDEYFNAIGEFVHEPENQCKPTDENKFVQPTKYQILPCSAIGQREADNADAIFMVRKSELLNSSSEVYLPQQELRTGIHFTWRYSEYWCSRHHKIRPDLHMFTMYNLKRYEEEFKKTRDHTRWFGYYLLRKAADYWLLPKFFGIADIRVSSSNLECTKSVIDYKTGTVNHAVAPWIMASDPFRMSEDYYADGSWYDAGGGHKPRSCRVKLYDDNKVTFGGRCNELNEQGANQSNFHTCNLDISSVEFEGMRHLRKYGDYRMELIENRTRQCDVECKYPQKDNLGVLASYPPYSEKYEIKGSNVDNLTASTSSVARFLRGRKYHGIVSIFATMFFTPVSIFSARYYKETFMKWQSEGCHIWLWIHLGSTLGSLFLYLSSLSALTQAISNWGRSQTYAGSVHTIWGWISHGIFFLLVILGGFRMGTRQGNRGLRIFMMTLHSLFGFLNYFLNVAMIVTSSQIPSSPSLYDCDVEGLPYGVSTITILSLTWLSIDFSFHLVLTTLQYVQDKSMGIKRAWYFPIVPFLPHESHFDMRGSAFRKILLILYVVISFSFSCATAVTLGVSILPESCKIGPMSCNTDEYPFGCSELAKDFAKAITVEAKHS